MCQALYWGACAHPLIYPLVNALGADSLSICRVPGSGLGPAFARGGPQTKVSLLTACLRKALLERRRAWVIPYVHGSFPLGMTKLCCGDKVLCSVKQEGFSVGSFIESLAPSRQGAGKLALMKTPAPSWGPIPLGLGSEVGMQHKTTEE